MHSRARRLDRKCRNFACWLTDLFHNHWRPGCRNCRNRRCRQSSTLHWRRRPCHCSNCRYYCKRRSSPRLSLVEPRSHWSTWHRNRQILHCILQRCRQSSSRPAYRWRRRKSCHKCRSWPHCWWSSPRSHWRRCHRNCRSQQRRRLCRRHQNSRAYREYCRKWPDYLGCRSARSW